jgi:flagellar biosynthesis/type III secretory pathway M-ring protein FliF/YscJ
VVYVIVLVILFAVVFVITAPLRRAPAEANPEAEEPETSSEVLELEAERDAKYREIRDAELDHQTGKLSDEDFQAVDSTLRAEAIDILRRLDQALASGP